MRGATLNDLRADMLFMRSEGMSNGEIAEALDCSVGSVINVAGKSPIRRTTPVGYYNGRYRIERCDGAARAVPTDTQKPVEEPRIMPEEPPKPVQNELTEVWVMFPGGDVKWVFKQAYYVFDDGHYIVFRMQDHAEVGRFNSRSVIGVIARESK